MSMWACINSILKQRKFDPSKRNHPSRFQKNLKTKAIQAWPGGGSLAEELHEAALHHEPEASGHVEDDGEEDEVKRHPLVVRVIHDCVVTVVLKQQKN